MLLSLTLLAIAAPQTSTPDRGTTERAADKSDKMICKRFLETGSLVRGYRTCKTKAEWERDRDAAKASMGNGGPGCANVAMGAHC